MSKVELGDLFKRRQRPLTAPETKLSFYAGEILGAAVGVRNDTLNRVAFKAASNRVVYGYSWEQAESELVKAALSVGLPLREVEATVRSAFNSAPVNQPRMSGHSLSDATLVGAGWGMKSLSEFEVGAEETPVLLRRSDGNCLLYAGKVNALIGTPESGKTWLALKACKEAAQAGRPVVYLDFEDSPAAMKQRLVMLGCDAETVSRIFYMHPNESLDKSQIGELRSELERMGPALIVVDSVNDALTTFGLSINSNDDVTSFYQHFLHRICRSGTVVLVVDHVKKPSRDQVSLGAVGAQAKRALIDGVALLSEVNEHFGRGRSGSVRLRVDKDRPGFVRGVSCDGLAATVQVDSTLDSVSLRLVG